MNKKNSSHFDLPEKPILRYPLMLILVIATTIVFDFIKGGSFNDFDIKRTVILFVIISIGDVIHEAWKRDNS